MAETVVEKVPLTVKAVEEVTEATIAGLPAPSAVDTPLIVEFGA
jgi:hypothetical protein